MSTVDLTEAARVLSARLKELLGLVAAALTDEQIGRELFIMVRTVRSHLQLAALPTGALPGAAGPGIQW
jgi:DNA-binding NarL/FixJ family response regulator